MSNGTVTIHDERIKGPKTRMTNAHAGDILTAEFSPDDQFLVTCGMDCMVRLWALPDLVLFFEIVYGNPPRVIINYFCTE